MCWVVGINLLCSLILLKLAVVVAIEVLLWLGIFLNRLEALGWCKTLSKRSLGSCESRTNTAIRDLPRTDAALLKTSTEKQVLRTSRVG